MTPIEHLRLKHASKAMRFAKFALKELQSAADVVEDSERVAGAVRDAHRDVARTYWAVAAAHAALAGLISEGVPLADGAWGTDGEQPKEHSR